MEEAHTIVSEVPSPSLIRELPSDERPRERLLGNGGASLSDAELVAVLLRSGRPGRSVLELARERFGVASESVQWVERTWPAPPPVAAVGAALPAGDAISE